MFAKGLSLRDGGQNEAELPSRLLQVSLRKQEIADRLNAWIIFNEKNKELCEWLTQMENKVAHNSDLNIEEMVEKLKKVRGHDMMGVGGFGRRGLQQVERIGLNQT